MGEANTIRDVWLEAMAIFRRYPLATIAPALVLGAIGEVPTYLIDERRLLDIGVSLVTAYIAYYLYLAYAEGIVRLAERGEQRLSPRGMLHELVGAAHYVLSVLVAALIALAATTLATGLLVIPERWLGVDFNWGLWGYLATGLSLVPGMWLYTRWSLATPVIRDRGIGPLAATRRSTRLVRGHFWFVLMTATVAYYLEGAVIHAGALVAGSVTDSYTWGEWVGGTIVTTLVMPLAAFATSLVHSSVARRAELVGEVSRAKGSGGPPGKRA